jgi:hypothetical protein
MKKMEHLKLFEEFLGFGNSKSYQPKENDILCKEIYNKIISTNAAGFTLRKSEKFTTAHDTTRGRQFHGDPVGGEEWGQWEYIGIIDGKKIKVVDSALSPIQGLYVDDKVIFYGGGGAKNKYFSRLLRFLEDKLGDGN